MSKCFSNKETEDGEIDETFEDQKNDNSNDRSKSGFKFLCQCCKTPKKDQLLLTCKHFVNKACLSQNYDITKKLYCPICRKVAWVENDIEKKEIGVKKYKKFNESNKFYDKNKPFKERATEVHFNKYNGNDQYNSRKRKRWEFESNITYDESTEHKIPKKTDSFENLRNSSITYNMNNQNQQGIDIPFQIKNLNESRELPKSQSIKSNPLSEETVKRAIPYSIDGIFEIEKQQLIKIYRFAIDKGVIIPKEPYTATSKKYYTKEIDKNTTRSPEYIKRRNSPITIKTNDNPRAPTPKSKTRRTSSSDSHKKKSQSPQNELKRIPSVSKKSLSPSKTEPSKYPITQSKPEFKSTFVEEEILPEKPKKPITKVDEKYISDKFSKGFHVKERSRSKSRSIDRFHKTYNSERSWNKSRSPDRFTRLTKSPDKFNKKSWYSPENSFNKSRSPDRSFNKSKSRDRNKQSWYSPEKSYRRNYNTDKFYRSPDKTHRKPWVSPNKNHYQSRSPGKFHRRSRTPDRGYRKPFYKTERSYKRSRSPDRSFKKSYRSPERSYRKSRTPEKPIKSPIIVRKMSSPDQSIRVVDTFNHTNKLDDSFNYEVLLEDVKLESTKEIEHGSIEETLVSPKQEESSPKLDEKQDNDIKVEDSSPLSPPTSLHPPQVTTSQVSGTSSVVSAFSKSTIDPNTQLADSNINNINLLHSIYSRMYNASLRMKEFEVNSAEHSAAYQEYCDNYNEYQRLYTNFESTINLDNIQPSVDKHNTVQTPSHSSANSELPNPDDEKLDVNSLHEDDIDDADNEEIGDKDTNSNPNDDNIITKKSPSHESQNIQLKQEETIDEALGNDEACTKVNNISCHSMKNEDDRDTKKVVSQHTKNFGFLWLSNLSSSTRAHDICGVFKKYGHVNKVKIFEYRLPSTSPVFYGLVCMSNSNDAEIAMKGLQNYQLLDTMLSIKRLQNDPIASANKECSRIDIDNYDASENSNTNSKTDTIDDKINSNNDETC